MSPSRAGREERERLIAELERKNEELERFTYTVSQIEEPSHYRQGFSRSSGADLAAAKPDLLRKDMERIGEPRTAWPCSWTTFWNCPGGARRQSLGIAFRGGTGAPCLEAVSGVSRNVVWSWRCCLGWEMFMEMAPGCGVFQNHLENAVKYMGTGKPPYRDRRDASEMNSVLCCDNGIGIEPGIGERFSGSSINWIHEARDPVSVSP
jgi:signal transduction histidine kinase